MRNLDLAHPHTNPDVVFYFKTTLSFFGAVNELEVRCRLATNVSVLLEPTAQSVWTASRSGSLSRVIVL
ncbi:hypothetical protein WN51_02017 [Melipona quadrifasciata]|uniref:Uncharacterized protein n=1 Tax=Melipona quadrifasciata TaxID=166423 RepID=A0A0M9AD67_9HYME|nr:hypothetical protein WN51_02017 [Melipona quadrifasciata]